jgi:putative protein kinase ArgK-like GTPase of G3E family
MLEMGDKRADDWQPPIYQTEALNGKGIEKLMAGIRFHHNFLHKDLHQRRKRKLARFEFLEILRSSVMKRLQQQLSHNGELDR